MLESMQTAHQGEHKGRNPGGVRWIVTPPQHTRSMPFLFDFVVVFIGFMSFACTHFTCTVLRASLFLTPCQIQNRIENVTSNRQSSQQPI